MHTLLVICLVTAYLAANVYSIVKVRVFELARSRKHLLLYGVPFILWWAMSPTLRSVRPSSELSGPTLGNTSNVVLNASAVLEWLRVLEAKDST